MASPNVAGAQVRQPERAAHPPHLRQRGRRSPRTRPAAARRGCGPAGTPGRRAAARRRDVVGGGGIVTSSPEVVHRDEGDHLVERSFHEELDLAVLVGGAHGADRAWARCAPPCPAGPRACPGSRPRAADTTRRTRAAGRCTASARGCGRRDRRRRPSGARRRAPAGFARRSSASARSTARRGAGEQRRDVDADQRRGQQPDRREHAEPAADVGRHVERRDAVARGDLAQRAARRIGGEHQMPVRRARRARPRAMRARRDTAPSSPRCRPTC